MSRFELRTERFTLRPLADQDRDELRTKIFAHPSCVKTLIGDASTREKQKKPTLGI